MSPSLASRPRPSSITASRTPFRSTHAPRSPSVPAARQCPSWPLDTGPTPPWALDLDSVFRRESTFVQLDTDAVGDSAFPNYRGWSGCEGFVLRGVRDPATGALSFELVVEKTADAADLLFLEHAADALPLARLGLDVLVSTTRGSAVRFRAAEIVATVTRAATQGPSIEPLPFAFQLSAFELAWTPLGRDGSPGVPITSTYPPAEP